NLHFLGRKGSRVKIHGHSVDLMEIEAALSSCPGVMKAAVLAVSSELEAEPVRLVAYVALREDAVRDPQAIQRYLATRLPSYMLPSGVVCLEELPLIVSGKIDRKALTQIDPMTASPKRTVETPQDGVERTVA